MRVRDMTISRAAHLAIGAVASAMTAGCTMGPPEQPPEPPRNVRVLEVSRTTLQEFLVISGPIEPLQGTDLASEEMGTVEAIPFDKGSVVKAGDAVVLLDRDLLEAEMKAAEADRELAEYGETRVRKLFEARTVTGLEMQQATTALEKARAAEEMARTRYRRAAIRAPYAGIVTDRYVELGQYVTPGQPVVRIADPYTVKLAGSITEREVPFVEAGDPAVMEFDGVTEPVSARVEWVGFEAAPATGKFPVEIHIDNRRLLVRPGVVGRARILKAEHPDVVAIPRDAIMETMEGHTVFVVNDSIAHRRHVELGPDQGLMVAIRGGLNPGELLVVRGQRDLVDSARVAIREEADSRDGGLPSDPGEVRQSDVTGGER